MDTIIRILPDSVANQIAAGEVVQRPASVVKELMENAIDAGATQIDVVLKDAGKTLIQVVDNGKGMNLEDARTAFLRHATSKIRQADDLFHIRSMGFRGEALASIAAVAQVELVTRRPVDELAWKIELEGSVISNEEPTLAAQGSRFTVRNLFYNIPARRKFMGDNAKEFKAIRDEFIQIVLVYPQLSFSLTHNEEVVYQLLPSSIKQRIITLFGKRSGGQLNKQLYPVEVETQLVSISGFAGDPAAACLRDPLQYFFVNGRYIRHKYFRNAVLKAYETLLPSGMQPMYFLFFEVSPESLDVNIHPTKTEVKFEYEQAIWPIIHATVREALGKFNAIPSIDFDRDDAPEISVFRSDRVVSPPTVTFNPSYNPFTAPPRKTVSDWSGLYEGFFKDGKSSAFSAEPGSVETIETCSFDPDAPKFQILGTFVAINCRTSFVLVHQQRAHVCILYDRYRKALQQHKLPSQVLMFPVKLMLDQEQRLAFDMCRDTLIAFGFQFEVEADDLYVIAVPVCDETPDPEAWVSELIHEDQETGLDVLKERFDRLAFKMARLAAIPCGRLLSDQEMYDLILRLSDSKERMFTPDGKRVAVLLTEEELLKRF